MKNLLIVFLMSAFMFTSLHAQKKDTRDLKLSDMIIGKGDYAVPFSEIDSEILFIRYSLSPKQAVGKGALNVGVWNDKRNVFSIDYGHKSNRPFSWKENDARVRWADTGKVVEFSSFIQLWMLLEEAGYNYLETFNQYPAQFEAGAAQKGGVIARTVHVFRK